MNSTSGFPPACGLGEGGRWQAVRDPLQHHQANRQPVPAKALPGDLAVGDAISQRHVPDAHHGTSHVRCVVLLRKIIQDIRSS